MSGASGLRPHGHDALGQGGLLSAPEVSAALLLDEQGSDPATPAATKWKLYVKSGGVYARSSAGTVVGPFAAAGGGSSFVGCVANRLSGNQSIPNSSFEYVKWPDTDGIDTNAFHFTSDAALTGTVSKSNGSATITGSGTSFTTELSVNQVFSVPGGGGTNIFVVTAIASNTSLTVAVASNRTASGQTGTRRSSAIAIPATFGQKYEGECVVAWDGDATGSRALQIYRNDSDVIGEDIIAGQSFAHYQRVTFPAMDLVAGDFLEVATIQDSGTTRQIELEAVLSIWFRIKALGT